MAIPLLSVHALLNQMTVLILEHNIKSEHLHLLVYQKGSEGCASLLVSLVTDELT